MVRANGRGVPGALGLCGSAGDGAVDIHDEDLRLLWGMEFAPDGREGVEEQVAGVSHDGSASRGDLVAGEEFVEFAEGAVDCDSGGELPGITDEFGGHVGGVPVFPEPGGVAEAEAGSRIGNELAAAAFAGAVRTAGKLTHDAGVRCFRTWSVVHFVSSIWGGFGAPTRQFL